MEDLAPIQSAEADFVPPLLAEIRRASGQAKYWTPEQDAELTRLVADKLCALDIGLKMGFSKNAIIGRCHRIGIKLKGSPDPNRPRPEPRRRSSGALITRKPKRPTSVPVIVPPNFHPIPFLEVGADQCRFPLGEPTYDMMVCGSTVAPDHVYCPYHCKIAYWRKDQPLERMAGHYR